MQLDDLATTKQDAVLDRKRGEGAAKGQEGL